MHTQGITEIWKGKEMPTRLTLRRWIVALGSMVAVFGVPAAVAAHGIAFTARGASLQRHSLATGRTTTVGSIGTEVAALAFAPDGQLWGMEEGGRLVRIDAATGAGTQLADPFGPTSGFAVSDVTFDLDGVLWVVGLEGEAAVLYEVDVMAGSATLIGELAEPVTAIADFDGVLYGLADLQLYIVDRTSGGLIPATDAFFADASAMDLSPAGDLWLLSTIPGDPPIDFLAGFELEFGEEVAPPVEISTGSRGLAIEPGGSCVPSATEMCLLDRFRVEVTWRNFRGVTGPGRVVPETSDRSGIFSFFNPDNWELLVKALDGCDANGHYWFFAAQATNVEYTLVVTDTESGLTKPYLNPLGVTPQPVTDTTAFETCP